jgi:hypothetical protein
MLRLAGPLLALTACWRAPAPPPPLRGIADTAAPAPPRQTSWRGTCGDESYGWEEEIAVTLTVREEGDELFVTGTLAFADRRTRARLRGQRSSGTQHLLRGEMKELDGLGTRWGLLLELELSPTVLRGRFTEVLDEGAGEDEMCRFEWTR